MNKFTKNILNRVSEKRIVLEAENKPLTNADFDNVEKFADKLFAKIDLDVRLTKHFKDQVNNARNGKQITSAELIRLFKQEFTKYKNEFKNLEAEDSGIWSDLQTDINLPFKLEWDSKNKELELVTLTVMRKKGFKSNSNEKSYEVGSSK